MTISLLSHSTARAKIKLFNGFVALHQSNQVLRQRRRNWEVQLPVCFLVVRIGQCDQPVGIWKAGTLPN